MKSRCYLLAILLGFSQVSGAYTRLTPERHHFLSVDAAIGYASLDNNAADIKSGSGAAVNVGVGYRVYYNRFLFSTGVEWYYLYNVHSMAGVQRKLDMMDTEGMPFTLIAEATNGRDVCHSFNLNIPVLFGGEFRKFYFLLGPKISYNFYGQAESSAMLTTKGEYERYIGVFEDMPNHQLQTSSVSSGKLPLTWNIDILAHFEAGLRLGDLILMTGADIPKPKQRFYVALYADYGILNIHRNASTGERLGYRETTDNGVEFYMTPALLSNELRNIEVHQYQVGIKATILFELPQRKPCVICKD